jgi:putative ABC transport system substrate-binding protein
MEVNDVEIARPVGLQAQIVQVRGPEDFEGALKSAVTSCASALLFRAHPVFRVNQSKLIDLVAKSRLPAMYAWKEFVEAGGLMTYGPSLEDMYRRTATHVDKILKGTKPADIPVEQPMKFEFVVNLKTAKLIGVTIEPNVLVRANKVIR